MKLKAKLKRFFTYIQGDGDIVIILLAPLLFAFATLTPHNPFLVTALMLLSVKILTIAFEKTFDRHEVRWGRAMEKEILSSVGKRRTEN